MSKLFWSHSDFLGLVLHSIFQDLQGSTGEANTNYKDGSKVMANPQSCCPPTESAHHFCWGYVITSLLLLLAFALSLCICWPQIKARRKFWIWHCQGSLHMKSSRKSSYDPCRACDLHLHAQEAECILGERLVRSHPLQAARPASLGTLATFLHRGLEVGNCGCMVSIAAVSASLSFAGPGWWSFWRGSKGRMRWRWEKCCCHRLAKAGWGVGARRSQWYLKWHTGALEGTACSSS